MATRTFRRAARATALLSVALVSTATHMPAQRRAVFRGQVFDSSGVPLPAVEVTLVEAQRALRTDSTGVFVFREVPPAFYHVTLREPGYQAISGTARISDGDSIDLHFWMKKALTELDTVHVSQVRPSDPLADFKRRMGYGTGTYITSKRLDELKDWYLSSIIRAEAGRVQITPLGSGGWALSAQAPSTCLGRGCPLAPSCFLAVWVDGIRVYAPGMGQPPDLSLFRTEDLVGIEIYPGPAETPLELNTTGSSCGTVVLWTRIGRPPPKGR